MVLGKKVAIFDWEWGRNLAPREGQKMACLGCLLQSASTQRIGSPSNSVTSS